MEQGNKITILAELDPVMETIGLLFLLGNKENYKEHWIQEINEYGISGEHFFEKHAHYIEKYVAEFEKYYNPVEDIKQFITIDGDMDMYFKIFFYSLVTERHWLEQFDNISEEEILERIIKTLSARSSHKEDEMTLLRLRTTDKFIAFLDDCDFDDREKWLFLQLYCQPKTLFGKFVNLVNTNISAYEKAVVAVKAERDQLVESALESIQEKKLKAYENLVDGIDDAVVVYPCFVMPDSLAILKSKVYYGVLLDYIPLQDNSPEETRAFLQMRLKALSDTSKLQIMQFLKEGEKYNLEIAEHLGITPATTSHHMNVLLATGLIGINKHNGKVYYHLDKEVIKTFVMKLEQYLI